MVNVLIPKETRAGETRVAATPETVKKMTRAGLEVTVERGAGAGAFIDDQAFADAGATLAEDRDAALAAADAVLCVQAPPAAEIARLKDDGAILVGLLAPHANLDLVRACAERGTSAMAMELVPRISRAQTMDALSSQASIAGYKAVLLAATHLGKYFPLLMTAAGTIKPAKVVVMGAGVAGLQAIATARRLGAVVEVSDIREVVQEQVESLGARFIPLPEREEGGEGEGGYAREMTPEYLAEQRAIVARHVAAADVVICTALVPGKKAPLLVSREMVESMRAGSVIVDLAVEQGGNCALSEADREVVHQGVTILGPSNLAATMPADASQLYARNVWALLEPTIGKREADEGDGGDESEGATIALNLDDEVIAGALLTHAGEVRHAPTRDLLDKGAAS